MARDVRNRAGLHKADAQFLADIERVGWNVTMVIRTESDDDGPEWAYSCGLFHTFGHPELLLPGVELNEAAKIINDIGSFIQRGNMLALNREYTEFFANCKCLFRAIDSSQYRDYVGRAIWFYEGEAFPFLQCFWPNKFGRYPWEPETGDWIREAQPFLFIPKTEK